MFNPFKVTTPTVIGTLILLCMTGFALGVYHFRLSLFVFFMFVGGQFHPLSNSYVACA